MLRLRAALWRLGALGLRMAFVADGAHVPLGLSVDGVLGPPGVVYEPRGARRRAAVFGALPLRGLTRAVPGIGASSCGG